MDNLARIRDLVGGQDHPIAQPIIGGAALTMAAFLIAIWLLALVPLTLWQVRRSLLRRTQSGRT
jgi:hypothetical protein